MATLLHGVIGVQHAAMAIYNAYVDRVPIVMIAGLDYDGPVAAHNATDMGALVRGFTKWDAQPRNADRGGRRGSARVSGCGHAADGAGAHHAHGGDSERRNRGPRTISVPPYQAAADSRGRLRRDEADRRGARRRPESADQRRPSADARRREARDRTRRTASARRPGAARPAGPMSFPMSHPLRGDGVAGVPVDFVIAAQLAEVARRTRAAVRGGRGGAVARRTAHPRHSGGLVVGVHSRPGAAGDEFQRRRAPGRNECSQTRSMIEADAEASLPGIIEEVKTLLTADKRRLIAERAQKATRRRTPSSAPKEWAQAVEQARRGWDGSPISLGRLHAELWPLIKDEDVCVLRPERLHRRPRDALVQHGQAVQLSRKPGRRRHGLRRASQRRRRPGRQESRQRPHRRQHPMRRRSQLRARCAVDDGASSAAGVDRDAQQPRHGTRS